MGAAAITYIPRDEPRDHAVAVVVVRPHVVVQHVHDAALQRGAGVAHLE